MQQRTKVQHLSVKYRLCLQLAIFTTVFTLSGCSQDTQMQEVIEPPPPSTPLQEVSMGSWGSMSFNDLNGYVQGLYEIELYPFFKFDAHIILKRIDLSGQPILEMTASCLTNATVMEYPNNIVVVSNGMTTYGYRIFEGSAILAETDSLPSSYVRLALENVWSDS